MKKSFKQSNWTRAFLGTSPPCPLQGHMNHVLHFGNPTPRQGLLHHYLQALQLSQLFLLALLPSSIDRWLPKTQDSSAGNVVPFNICNEHDVWDPFAWSHGEDKIKRLKKTYIMYHSWYGNVLLVAIVNELASEDYFRPITAAFVAAFHSSKSSAFQVKVGFTLFE